MNRVKKWNDFNLNPVLNEGLFDFFKGKEDKDFQRSIKEVKESFKKLGINPKFESSRDIANWTWSDSVYGTRLNLQIELRVNQGKFICDVPDYPDLSFKNDFGIQKFYWQNVRSGLDHVVESLFKINYPYSEVEEVFKELGDSLDDVSKPNFDFVFVSYGGDFIPSGTRCAWEIEFSMPESRASFSALYDTEYNKVLSDIESRLNNMGWSLDLYENYLAHHVDFNDEFNIDFNDEFDIVGRIILTYHCYPTEYRY